RRPTATSSILRLEMSTANREEPSISLKPRQLEPGRSSGFASPLVPPTTRGRHARLGQTHGALSRDYHQAKHTSSAFTTDGLAAGDLSMKPVPTRGCSKRCHGIICRRMSIAINRYYDCKETSLPSLVS